MSQHTYANGRIISRMYGFQDALEAAMRLADPDSLAKLKAGWPEVWDELNRRYNAPEGLLPGETHEKVRLK
jgi:hypothetical protein